MPIEFSCNTDGDWRGPTGNLFLAGSVAHPLITCSHSLTKRSIAIGSCGGSRIEHGHYLEGGQHRSRKSYLQLHQNMIELILYSFAIPEQQSFTATRKLHLPNLSAGFGRVFFGQLEDGTLGGKLTL